ncbi:hypothetical protein E2C01_044433 [Portunus trituberculatus]|uniref:Uncharacterized protein n=1 Tax=Portunus trituberculatus TaxID=210409 RepID=A0A5B7FZ84_PORTR|nr:hypothetical protein [Portunus trituberculatus]
MIDVTIKTLDSQNRRYSVPDDPTAEMAVEEPVHQPLDLLGVVTTTITTTITTTTTIADSSNQKVLRSFLGHLLFQKTVNL